MRCLWIHYDGRRGSPIQSRHCGFWTAWTPDILSISGHAAAEDVTTNCSRSACPNISPSLLPIWKPVPSPSSMRRRPSMCCMRSWSRARRVQRIPSQIAEIIAEPRPQRPYVDSEYVPAQFTGFSTSAVFINRSSADSEAAAELVRWWDEKGHRSVFVNSVAGGDDEWIDQFRATVADAPHTGAQRRLASRLA